MPARCFFVTGTDTGIGKTRATLYLMRALQGQGLTVIGAKPVATGATLQGGRWVNADALALQAASSIVLPYERINPWVFAPPVSPHLAAALAGQRLELAEIGQWYRELAESADVLLIEGVGGWRVPLNERDDLADLVQWLGIPVLLVVGLRLGCLNHALLSHDAIHASGCRMTGWIANRVEADYLFPEENLATLSARFGRDRLLEIPYRPGADDPGNDPFRDGDSAKTLAILRALTS